MRSATGDARDVPPSASDRAAAARYLRRLAELIEQEEFELRRLRRPSDSCWLGVPAPCGRPGGRRPRRPVLYGGAPVRRADRDLLAFVGQHVGAALSRARAIEETRQRNAELALINSVQSALAGELELQAIYDVVGDKIQEVFDAQVVDIGIYNEAAGLIHFPYTIERGVRFPDEPIELIGFRKHAMETREPLMIAESTPRGGRALRQPVHPLRRAGEVRALRPAGGRPPGHRRHLPPEPRPRARLHRRRPAAADHARRQPQRRARERAPRPRDPATECRARADQQRPGGARRRARARRRSTTSSATSSRRSSTPRWSTSRSSTRRPASSPSRT